MSEFNLVCTVVQVWMLFYIYSGQYAWADTWPKIKLIICLFGGASSHISIICLESKFSNLLSAFEHRFQLFHSLTGETLSHFTTIKRDYNNCPSFLGDQILNDIWTYAIYKIYRYYFKRSKNYICKNASMPKFYTLSDLISNPNSPNLLAMWTWATTKLPLSLSLFLNGTMKPIHEVSTVPAYGRQWARAHKYKWWESRQVSPWSEFRWRNIKLLQSCNK